MSDLPAFRPLALLAAVAFPGAGHMVCGDVRRGVYACLGVLGMFFGGMFIGGIGAIDRKAEPIWFIGQALVGPLAFGVSAIHQSHFKVIDPVTGRLRPANPDEGRGPDGKAVAGTPPYQRAVGKMQELGMLYACIGGMLNLIVIIDAAFPSQRPGPRAASPGGGRA